MKKGKIIFIFAGGYILASVMNYIFPLVSFFLTILLSAFLTKLIYTAAGARRKKKSLKQEREYAPFKGMHKAFIVVVLFVSAWVALSLAFSLLDIAVDNIIFYGEQSDYIEY